MLNAVPVFFSWSVCLSAEQTLCLTWGTDWGRAEERGRQIQPPHHPPLLSGVEEPQVLRLAGRPEPDVPDDSDVGLSGPSLEPCAARCAPGSLRLHTPPVGRTANVLEYRCDSNRLMCCVRS